MKRFYAMLVYVPITAGLMVLWPVDEVFTADTTAPALSPAADTVSSAVASASSAIATASSAIATASSAIATASSAIATASSAIATDPSAAAVDAVACDDDTTDLCDIATSADTSVTTSAATSTITGDDCSTVASALRLGHVADDPTVQQVDDDRGGTGRSLDIVGPSRLADRFNRVDVRPRTVGVKMTEKVILTAVTVFFENLELALLMSLYKLKLIYTTVIAPVLGL